MKKGILSLMFCSLAAMAANAQLWVKPTPVLSPATEMKVAEENDGGLNTYYLWSEDCQAFLGRTTRGGDHFWGVRTAARTDVGQEIYFQKYKVDGVWQEGNYYFNNYLVNENRWDWMWIDIERSDGPDANVCYVDFKNQGRAGYSDANPPLWNIEVGTTLRIKTGSMNPVFNPADQNREFYLGLREGGSTDEVVFYPNCQANDKVDWRVVTKPNYEAYVTRWNTYVAAGELAAAIKASKDTYDGIDLSVVEAVYNNTSSTEAELKAAQAQIPEIEKAYVATHSNASVNNPQDVTSLIQNPNYDGNADGWTLGGMAYKGDNRLIEKWSSNNETYDMFQQLTGLPNGVYEVKVHALHRIGDYNWDHYKSGILADDAQVNRTSQVYANDYFVKTKDLYDDARTSGISWDVREMAGKYVPNGISYADVAFNEYGDYENSVFCAVTDGNLKIGIRCQDRIAYSWTCVDSWSLTYYGNAADAITMLKAHLKDNIAEYDEDVLIQASLRTAYEAAMQQLENSNDPATIEKAYNTAMQLFYDMERSRMAYDHFVTFVENDIDKQLSSLFCDEADELSDYVDGDEEGTFGYIIENTPFSVEELAQEEARLKALLELAIKNTVEEGKDYTSLIPNADMAQADFKALGWDVEWEGENFAGRCGNQNYYTTELWNYRKFNISYTLTGMPKGIYEVSLPALWRSGDQEYDKPASGELYVNNMACDIMSEPEDALTADQLRSIPDYHDNWSGIDGYNSYVDEEKATADNPWPHDYIRDVDGVTKYWPSSTFGASVAFNAGRYINKVYGIVGEDGKLTIGLRSKNMQGRDIEWICLGHITLTYLGESEDGIDGLKEEADRQADYYVNDNSSYFYQNYKEELKAATATLLDSETLDELKQGIEGVNAVYAKITGSMELYAQLEKASRLLYEAAGDAVGEEEITEEEGLALMGECEKHLLAIEEGTYDNETATSIIFQLEHNKLIDYIAIRGGLFGTEGDNWDNKQAPRMYRNAEGKYVGVAKFRDERHGNLNKYAGNRSLVAFNFRGQDISAMDNDTRFLNTYTGPRRLKMNSNSSWFVAWGGEWEFTIDLEAETMTCRQLDEPLYKNQIYAVGNLRDNSWQLNYETAANWQLLHQGNGIYQGAIAFNDGVERGEVTLFAADMWLTGNWGDGRIGCPTDQVQLADGQEVEVNRFEGDRKWILDPAHKYLATYDVNRGTVRFDVRDLPGDDTEESPLLINDFEDLMMMRAYLRQGETHYFALTGNISLKGKQWAELNGSGAQGGKEYQKWIHLDGRGHFISGFTGNHSLTSEHNNSFFGVLGGTVKNLGFVDCHVTEDTALLADYDREHSETIAILAGKLGSPAYRETTVVENVFVQGSVLGGKDHAGALAGTIEGNVTVTNFYAQADVLSDATNVAGIAGQLNGNATLRNGYYVGEVTSSQPLVATITASAIPEATNIVNWTRYAGVYTPYSYDGTNHAELQQLVVSFDPNAWSCGNGTDEYPVLTVFNEAWTGIAAPATATPATATAIFDLQGRRVAQPTRGLYIIDGKKQVIR